MQIKAKFCKPLAFTLAIYTRHGSVYAATLGQYRRNDGNHDIGAFLVWAPGGQRAKWWRIARFQYVEE